jgi:hypothetical protein
MTESEWVTCTDPARILDFLKGKVSERKMRLFACACCRRVWQLLDERKRTAVEMVERAANEEDMLGNLATAAMNTQLVAHRASQAGIIGLPEWFSVAEGLLSGETEATKRLVCWIAGLIRGICNDTDAASRALLGDEIRAARVAWAAAQSAKSLEMILQCNLLREILGNPFRPVKTEPSWLTETVLSLATVAYEERSLSSGELDNSRLAIIADSLQEAGCTNADILEHLRSNGVHIRGCWVLDLIRG